MKRTTLLKTTLAASIALTSLMAMAGCDVDHDDHHGDWNHRDDHHDDHQQDVGHDDHPHDDNH